MPCATRCAAGSFVRDQAAVLAHAGRRPRHRTQHRRRRLRAARRRRMAGRAGGVGYARRPSGGAGCACIGADAHRNDAPAIRPACRGAGSRRLPAHRYGSLRAARRRAPRPYEVLGYSDPRGLPELRQGLAAYLGRARGVRVAPDRLVVCSGFTQGLAVLCQRAARTRRQEARGSRPTDSRLTAMSLPPEGCSCSTLHVDSREPS